MPTWSVGYPTTNYAGLIDGQDYLPVPDGMSYSGTPEGNTEAYWTAFNTSKYTSLKDLADKTMVLQSLTPLGTATKECGFSLANGTARDLPAQVQWKDFGYSHQGPCEVWCDDRLAFRDTNCALHARRCLHRCRATSCLYRCEDESVVLDCTTRSPWQLYLNCVPLSSKANGIANAVVDENDLVSTTDFSAVTIDVPETTTQSSSASVDSSTTAPEATPPDTLESATPEATPVTPTATPSPPTAVKLISKIDEGISGAKCSRRRK